MKRVYRNRRTVNRVSTVALESYKEQMHLAIQEPKPLVASQIRRAAKSKLQKDKNNTWREYLNKCANERNHFKLAQSIYNKDFIKIKTKKF